jgi:hypothetical protein
VKRLALVLILFPLAAASPAAAADCPNAAGSTVPGAEVQKQACLDDLTTAGTVATGHTDESDWAGLNASQTKNPSGVPGLQIDGYFPDTSTTNSENGWNHDAQFVIRLPNDWNGKLVVTGAPGIRKQYSPDFVIGDWAVAHGYAYASTDKGNTGTSFYTDGATPGDAVAEWNMRVTQLTIAAKQTVERRYGRGPARTYMTGISNGGYLTRWQLENRPDLYDGGVDWEGTLFTADGPNLFTYLPAALKNYPRYRATGDQAAHDAMIAAGFAPGSEFLWPDHYAEYWDLTQRTYREEFDPEWDGAMQAGTPFCQSGTPNCDADYDYGSRPAPVHAAVGKVSNTGRIGKPMLTLHGTLDSLLPEKVDSDVYARMVAAAGAGALHRYYVIEAGNHVDGRYDAYPSQLRPILPCYRTAFSALEAWVEKGTPPPPSQFVHKPATGDVVNECALAQSGGAGPTVPSGPAATPTGLGERPRGRLVVKVTPRRDRRAPYRFRTAGRLVPPRGYTAAESCTSGRVSVQVKAGRRTISARRAKLRRTCRFASRVTFGHARRLGRGRLRFIVRFSGNRVVAPGSARTVRVRALKG